MAEFFQTESPQNEHKFLSFREKGGETRLLPIVRENIIVSRPQKRQGKQGLLEIKYRLNGVFVPLTLQFPRMHSPFPLGSPYDPERTSDRHIVLGFHGEDDTDTDNPLRRFRETMDMISSAIIDILATNSADWFGGHKKLARSSEVIRASFHDIIKDGYSERMNRQYPDNPQ